MSKNYAQLVGQKQILKSREAKNGINVLISIVLNGKIVILKFVQKNWKVGSKNSFLIFSQIFLFL